MAEVKFLQIAPNAIQEIRKLYNLDGPGRMEDAIEILDTWIKQQKHILKKDFKKKYLERALLVNKGSLEKTKKRIDVLCTMRTITPHFFKINNSRTDFEELFKKVSLVPLPALTQDLYRVVIIKIKNLNFTRQNLFMIMQYSIIASDYISHHDYSKGFIFVDDFLETNLFDFVTSLSITDVQQFASIVLKGYGSRIKAIHILSQSKAVELFKNILVQFFSIKLKDRIHVHKDIDELLNKDLPKDIFPKEYGGKMTSLDVLMKEWMEVTLSKENLDHFKSMSMAGTDETLRQTAKFNEEYMGMPGSFRNLKLD